MAAWPSSLLELSPDCEFKNTETNAYLRPSWASIYLFNDPGFYPFLCDREQHHLTLPAVSHLLDLSLCPNSDLSVSILLHSGPRLHLGPPGHSQLPPV
jgi:hypothetical protein